MVSACGAPSVVAARQPDFLHGSAELQSQEPERVPLEAILALLTKPWKSFCVIYHFLFNRHESLSRVHIQEEES